MFNSEIIDEFIKIHPVLFIDQIRQLEPDSPQADIVEARIFMREKLYDKALNAYRLAYDKGARGSSFLTEISEAYHMSGDKQSAYKLLKDYIAVNKGDVGLRHILAGYYIKDGLFDRAVLEYDVILSYASQDEVALNNLAWLYLQQENYPEAKRIAKRSYNLRPNIPAFIDTYGWVLVKSGEHKRGLELLQKAVSRGPNMMDLRYHLAYALYQTGNTVAAKRELERVLSSGVAFAEYEEAQALLSEITNP